MSEYNYIVDDYDRAFDKAYPLKKEDLDKINKPIKCPCKEAMEKYI